MGHSNGKISAPISLHADVYAVLGVSKSGTYYDTGYICSNAHGKINPFSKKKPVRQPVVNTNVDQTFYDQYGNPFNMRTDWWRASDGFCGFNVVQDDYQTTVEPPAWTYLPPRPGTDWCRLTDFNGYDHNANRQLITLTYPQTIQTNVPLKVTVNINNIGSSTALCLSDVLGVDGGNYGGFHFDGTYGTYTLNKDVDWDGVSSQVVCDLGVLTGITAGQDLRLAVKGKDSAGRIKNLRFAETFQTRLTIRAVSNQPYEVFIQVQAVLRYMESSQAYVSVMNAVCVFNATSYAGGTIPEGGFGVWRQEYEGNMDVASASGYVRIPSQTIAAGESKRFALETPLTFYSPVNETRVIFRVLEGAYTELARLDQPIQRMNG